MFKVNVVLDNVKVQFAPSYDQLEKATIALAQDTAYALAGLQRITQVLLKSNEFSDYATAAANDKECVKQLQAITQGLHANEPHLKVITVKMVQSLCHHQALLYYLLPFAFRASPIILVFFILSISGLRPTMGAEIP